MASTYNFPNHITGDTYRGAVITLSDADGNPIDIEDAAVAMRFRLGSKSGTEYHDFEISITNGAAGQITIPAQLVDWEAGVWYYDMEVTTYEDQVTTYMEGTMKVIQSVTN
jgi:hypothetical protein